MVRETYRVALVYSNVSADVPRAGNLVRIRIASLVADLRGDPPARHPNSAPSAAASAPRSDVTLHHLDPDGVVVNAIVPSWQPSNAKVEEVVRATGRMGHLIKTDLAAFTVDENSNPVPLSQVVLDWKVSYFANHGEPVNSAGGAAACTDATLYKGDCTANRGFLFLGWNGTTKNGSKAATGAYVARLRYTIKVAGQAKESGGLRSDLGRKAGTVKKGRAKTGSSSQKK